jgi:Permuted papain-like amidase enzyme, YaeF/YiiX, C92 family
MALLDYAAYRGRRGRYADAVIQAQGARIAKANSPELGKLLPGDVLFFHTRTSVVSWVVMYVTGSIWSHTAMYVGGGLVTDATSIGVTTHPLADYFNGASSFSACRPPFSERAAERAVDAMNSSIGKPYGWTTAQLIVWQSILGARRECDPRHAVDVLFSLAVLSVPAVFWRPWASVTGLVATLYLVTLARNRAAWLALRKGASPDSNSKPVPVVLPRYIRRRKQRPQR